jgi:tetratricopeptide (TPR) repeat protein
MEIHIKLAGVQLGPYSVAQVREYLAEGLLSPGDSALQEGTQEWIPVSELLAKASAPVDTLLETAPEEVPEAPKRAPSAPPGVAHLPSRQQDTGREPLPSPTGTLARRTNPIGPTAPVGPSPSGATAFSAVTTSPLVPQQGTKKVARESLIKERGNRTAPLATRTTVPTPGPPASARSTPAITPGSMPAGPKKSSLGPLAREMAAKTVPMRAQPASPPLPPTSPITAPLPTKPVFKPASGAIPPPSVVNALTKKLGHVVQPDPVQTSPPTLGLIEAEEIAAPKASASEKAADKPRVAKGSRRRGSKRLLAGLIYASAALALIALGYVWSPYHAAASLRNALNDGEVSELNAAIDFPAVRDSLKTQTTAALGRAGLLPDSGVSVSGIAAMINNSIDLYVTPEGLSGLVKKSDSNAARDQKGSPPTIAAGEATRLLLAFSSLPAKSQGLSALNDFVMDWDPARLHLQFQGLGWKLTRIELRPELALPSSPGSASALVSPVVETYLEWGDAKSKDGNWDAAIADYTQVLGIDPKSSAAYNQRGAARQAKGDLDGAMKDYTQALALNPQLATAYNHRGDAKMAKKDLDGAIADYTQAIHSDASLAVAYDSRGNAKIERDDLDGAIADYTQAISIDPNVAVVYTDRGFAREANGNFDGAITDYTQALALNPKSALAYYNRGLARQSQGNVEAAIVDFDQALTFDPKLAAAYYSRGNAKSSNQDLDGAIADFTQAVTLNPKIAFAFCNRALARQSKGDVDGALADYTQALAVDPKIAIAYYNRGLIKVEKGDFDGAIADSSQALDLDPKDAPAYYNRGFAKLAVGNLDGASADLKQFCDLAPRDHNADHARLYLWLIAKAQNSKTDADQELSDGLENNWNSGPDDLVSKTAAFLLGRVDETNYLAGAASPDAKTDQGQHCEAWYFAGMKRLLMGDKKGAIDAFNSCVATNQKTYCEYILSKGELQVLAPAAPVEGIGAGAAAGAAKTP